MSQQRSSPPLPKPTDDTRQTKKSGGWRRRLALVLLSVFVVLALIVGTLTGLLATTRGTKSTLTMVGYFTGMQIQGITGSLNRRINIEHLALHRGALDLVIEDLELEWHPFSLIQGQLQLDHVQINSLQIMLESGDTTPAKMPLSLQLPSFFKSIKADQVLVRRLGYVSLGVNHQRASEQLFSDLHGSVQVDRLTYQWQLSGATPWGSGTLKGKLASTAPFQLDGQADLTGFVLRDQQVTLPEAQVHSVVSGTLQTLDLQAQLALMPPQPPPPPSAAPALISGAPQTVGPTPIRAAKNGHDKPRGLSNSTSQQEKVGARGNVHIVFTPFARLPVDYVQIDLQGINPRYFYATAPSADLSVQANFKLRGDVKAPTLQGQLQATNHAPSHWDVEGIPVLNLTTLLTLTEHSIQWQDAQMGLKDGGKITSQGQYHFVPRVNANPINSSLDLAATFQLLNVNLAQLDTRLQKTQLSGVLKAASSPSGLQVNLDLVEKQPKFSGDIVAALTYQQDQTIRLQRLAIQTKQTELTAHGFYSLAGKQEFNLQAKAVHFNPAQWLNVPQGQISSEFELAGQIQQGWRIQAHIVDLSGQFAGQALHGLADLQLQQHGAAFIHHLALDWGASHLSAKGEWQLAGHNTDKPNSTVHPGTALTVSLAVPDLVAVSRPFEKILPFSLSGALYVDGVIKGDLIQPSGQLTIKAQHLSLQNVLAIDNLQATMHLADGAAGPFEGTCDARGLTFGKPNNADDFAADHRFTIESIQATLSGLRHAHQIDASLKFQKKQQVNLHAIGDLREGIATAPDAKKAAQWAGQVQQLDLIGPLDFRLITPFKLTVADEQVAFEHASWQGKLGQLQLKQFHWSPETLQTAGEFRGVQLVNAIRLWRGDLPFSGDLTLDGDWQFNLGQRIIGQMTIQRHSGDVVLHEISIGHTQPMPLGLQQLTLAAHFGQDEAQAVVPPNKSSTQNAHARFAVELNAQGDHLGLVTATVHSALNHGEQGWTMSPDNSLAGNLNAQFQNIQWMSPFFGAGIALRGQLNTEATISGTWAKPDYSATIHGQELQVGLTELGILLPNGNLDATINEHKLTLTQLKFRQSLKPPPRHDGLTDLPWLGEIGSVEASGWLDLNSGIATIEAHCEHFPFLQNPQSWLVGSGDALLQESNKTWALSGQLTADAAYFSVPKQAPPRLSSDVIVLQKDEKRGVANNSSLQTSVDFALKTGKNFIFVGRGINTRLDGELRLRSKNGEAMMATGSIQTVGGSYDGYGQTLAIERGIINFQGAPDNPGLNVRAMRRGLQVEAGVEIIGTVARPEVRLVSEPNVPDPDKLSWMVLGRASDQLAGSESAVLLSAAGAIFGGESGSNMPKDIAHSLGLDDLSVGTSSTTMDTQLPLQTVAGTITNVATSAQVVSVGKHITPDLVFSIERSLTEASNGVKLTWHLSRRFSIIGRAGSDNAIDGQYLFSFDGKDSNAVKQSENSATTNK